MLSFNGYLKESNRAGKRFEMKVMHSVEKWLHAMHLDNQFVVEMYGGGASENLDGRSEDYSDILVKDSNEHIFFIECKQSIKTNIVTTQFDITQDFALIPVAGKSRIPLQDEFSIRLAYDLSQTDEYAKFAQFLQQKQAILNGKCPADFYFNFEQATDSQLNKAIAKYNSMVDHGMVEADCKKFDVDTVRESTRNMLLCGICWRLHDDKNTWDICHLDDIPYFTELIKNHYLVGKSIPANYIQMSNELFVVSSTDNPFNIACSKLPSGILGKFDLKFTPRFGSGSMYMTPRSKITTDIESNASFIDKSRWPQIEDDLQLSK